MYRDDGIALSYATPKETETFKKEICKIFEKNGLKITIEANKKVIDFLDVTLDLRKKKFYPYMKPGNKLIYINSKSNHPPNVIKAVPTGINTRLSNISSDEEEFQKAAPPYQEALNKSGFKYKLEYKPSNKSKTPRRKHNRRVIWYNPPFDLNVKTNIGRNFLTIVRESFPKGHPLNKIFNKNTIKLSYSAMPNIKSKIDSHNKAIIKKQEKKEQPKCNCRNKATCPMDGKCQESGIIYQATVIQKDNGKTETYVGLTETTFKLRYGNHKQTFKNKSQQTKTELSKYIWELKNKQKQYDIKWKILKKAKPYSNTTKRCNLCMEEKYIIKVA